MKKYIMFLILLSVFGLGENLIQAQPTQKQPLLPAGSGLIEVSQAKQNCIPPEMYTEIWKSLDVSQKQNHGLSKTSFPLLRWPFENALHDGLILGNYVDDDDTNLIKDYMGNPHSYDGHNGTDMALYNFRAMDRGLKVIAAAGGVVVWTVYSEYDRNTGPPYAGFGNTVAIKHDDGTFAQYIHFRKNSLTVEVGETVEAGQVLGLAGSSGNSTGAHLHFEIAEDIGNVYTPRDPWHGTFNTLPSLWIEQEPYVGTAPLRIYDMGVFTEAAAGGDINAFPIEVFKDKLTQPKMMGANEPFVAVWLQMQGQVGDPYTLEILRPDNTVYSSVSSSLPFKFQYGWNYWFWSFAGNVSPSDYGIWTARIIINGNNVKQVDFEVGATTVYAPRFWPIAGRSFRIDGSIQRDTLRVSSLGGPVTYSLSHAPDFVTLADSIVTIAAVSTQPNRSLYFQAIASDAIGLTDTMWYHIVDPSKPLDMPVSVEEMASKATPESFSLSQNYPNPFNPETVIRYQLSVASEVQLTINNAMGQEIRTLVHSHQSPGFKSVVWDGKNNLGQPVSSGIYFYTLQAGERAQTKKMVLIR